MAGPGRRGGRLVEISKIADNHYEALIQLDDGRLVKVEARITGDIVETPFGSYHLPELILETLSGKLETRTSSYATLSWLVDFDESTGTVRAKLPVKIVSVEVREGEGVDEKTTVMLVETMKMVNEVHAPCRGVIVEVTKSSSVERGGVLFRIKCED